MAAMLKATLLLTLILLAHTQFNYDQEVQIDPDVFDAEFSRDFRLLALASPSGIRIHNAGTGAFLRTITPDSQATVMAMGGSSSKSSQLIAIGEDTGNITVYDPNTGNQVGPTTADRQSNITSLCFSSDSSMLVVAYDNETLRAYDWKKQSFDLTTELPGSSSADLKVSCQPDHPNNFVVSWTDVNETTPILSFYEISADHSAVNLLMEIHLKDYNETQSMTVITDITYENINPSTIYFVGDSSHIFMLNTTSQEIASVQDTEGTGPLNRIRVSADGSNIATLNQTHIILLAEEESFPELDLLILEEEEELSFVQQTFPTDRNILALNSQGGAAFYIPQGSNTADIKSQCSNSTFYRDGVCVGCSVGCAKCFEANECVACENRFFLSNETCKACMSRCQVCTAGNQCSQCQNPFIYRDSTCTCSDGQYPGTNQCLNCPEHCGNCVTSKNCTTCKPSYSIKNGQCLQGPSFLLFILVVGGVAVIMCAVIAVSVTKVIKQERKGQALLDDETM